MGAATQIGYASADLGLSTVEFVLRLYLLKFYTDVVGLSPNLAGVALALGLVLDAITDPLMGELSDRTKDRIGRRPFLLIGATILALGVVLVFRPVTGWSEGLKFAWLLGAYSLMNVGLTILAVPFTAMSGELTSDRHERSVLFGWRAVFANLGALFAAALPAIFARELSVTAGDGSGTASVESLSRGAFAIAIAVLATAGWAFLATRAAMRRNRRAHGVTKPGLSATEPLLRNFWAALRCPPFLPLLIAYVVAMIGIGLNSALALYFYEYYLELTKDEVNTLLIIVMGTFTVSVPFWVGVSRRLGKNPPLIGGALAFGIGTCLVYPLLPIGSFVHVAWWAAVMLGALVGSTVLLDSLLTDVIDYDRVHGGSGRAGVYFGIWRFASKVARAVAIGLTGLALDRAGFVPNQAQSDDMRSLLMWMFGPGVGALFIAAALALAPWRFTDRKQQQVQRLVQRRNEGRPAPRGSAGSQDSSG